jgi:hypothetical protein
MSDRVAATDSSRFAEAWRRFDEENGRDPNQVVREGRPQPRELVYARWLTDWVLKLSPSASEPLRLAARCQHLCRWMIPRHSYPMTRAGYLQWREALKKFHAQKSGDILRQVGYEEPIVNRVQELNLKKNLAHDAEVQVLEDALCLVFLEHQFSELAAKTTEDKMIGALQKTWKKMSAAGQKAAQNLPYAPPERALLERALSK